jgi:hypothetical protein
MFCPKYPAPSPARASVACSAEPRVGDSPPLSTGYRTLTQISLARHTRNGRARSPANRQPARALPASREPRADPARPRARGL